HFGTNDLRQLVEQGFLNESEYSLLTSGRAFLWQVRFALHILAGRAEDRLLFDHQRALARLFRSEEHTSELQSRENLVCRLLLQATLHHPDLHSFPTRRSSDLPLRYQ